MKKVLPVILCIALCVSVALVLPQLGTSTEFVDDEVCMTCHDHDDLSDNHSDCDICHESGFTAPPASTCIECHPLGDTGTCNLVDVHSFSDCLECHVECDEPTTTTTTDVSTTTTTTDVTTTTTTADVTTTTTTPVTTTTTTVSASNITVSPDTIVRSRWISLPAILAIQGNGTNFAQGSSKPAYSPDRAVIALPPLVLNAELIWQTVLVSPAWLAGAGNQTVTCTVDGGSDDFDINLLPFILDE
jgi:hypothetical protein